MRYGFTTGSCAAAAAKAAAYMLLTGREKHEITITTPKGILYHARMEEISRTEHSVRCAVRKDGGDDPDITTGTLIFAEVSWQEQKQEKDCGKPQILITGGAGVGTVTRPGLDQPVGSAAINHVPREMITREVEEVCALTDYAGSLLVEISVQGGEELAKKTFNPRLGIVGGISILGTTGIVEPMSSQALLDTIYVELKQKREEGKRFAAISPGNYGLEYMKRAYGFDLDRSVKCSNFIGQTIDMAAELGFHRTHRKAGKALRRNYGHTFQGGGRAHGASDGCGIPRRVCARYAGEDLRLSCDGGGARLHCQGRMSFRDDGTFNEKDSFLFKEAGERGTVCGMHSLCERVRRAGEKRRCGRTSGTNPRGRRTFAVTQFKEETVWYILSGRVREQRI